MNTRIACYAVIYIQLGNASVVFLFVISIILKHFKYFNVVKRHISKGAKKYVVINLILL